MKKVYLLAYLSNNMGDDLFIKIICNRYPQTLFYATSNLNINPMPANLVLNKITISSRLHNKVFRLLTGDKSATYIARHLKRKYNNLVCITGSGFMQKNAYDFPENRLYEKLFYKKGSYIIGCNFGPFYTDEFYKHYSGLFKKLSGITFRDEYSYDLFNDVENSLEAPDIVFGFDTRPYECAKTENTVLISVMDLSFGNYSNRSEYNIDYKKNIIETIKELIGRGYKVTILGMCEKENDDQVAHEIADYISDERLGIVSYPKDDMNKVLSEIAKSEYMISTRFHSFVLGVLFRCKVLPISYNIKVKNTINEIGFAGKYIDLSQLKMVSGKELADDLLHTEIIELDKAVKERASLHFSFLDSELK